MVLLVARPAGAADATYPPSGGEPTTSVQNVKSGVGDGVGSGLASTGFDPAFVVVGLAVLVVGIALVLVSRRRRAH
jgi:LPXTG-motif cell wall-anchored protein